MSASVTAPSVTRISRVRPATGRFAARRHDDIRPQHLAFGHRRHEDPELLLARVAQLRVVQQGLLEDNRLRARNPPSASARSTASVAWTLPCFWIGGLYAAIAARVVEMPVRVDDRRDRTALRALAMARIASLCQAWRPVSTTMSPSGASKITVLPVRAALGEHRAAQELNTGGDLFGRGTRDIGCRRGCQPKERRHIELQLPVATRSPVLADPRRAPVAAQHSMRLDVRNARPTARRA